MEIEHGVRRKTKVWLNSKNESSDRPEYELGDNRSKYPSRFGPIAVEGTLKPAHLATHHATVSSF